MTRKLFLFLLLIALSNSAHHAWAQGQFLIPQSSAQRVGLTRAWFTQVERALKFVTYNKGLLLAQTDQAIVHAIDAETGRTLWSTPFGNRLHPCVAAGANDKFVLAVNGSYAYLLDRATGGVIWRKQCAGSPGAGAALSEAYAFLPMVNGTMQGFDLKNAKEVPWVYRSSGHTWVQPLVTATTVSWTTERGHLYVGGASELGVRFRLEAAGGIESRPAYWTPNYYACSLDGFVYAVNEKTGHTVWKYSTGDRINLAPVAINDRVFVTPDLGGMHCLDAKTGALQWFSPGIRQFLSLTPTRIYAVDSQRRLVAIDAKTGGQQAWLPIPGLNLKLMNSDSDRLLLASDNGMIQCLHEPQIEKALVYGPPVAAPKEAPKAAAQKGLVEATQEGQPPAGGEAKPAEPDPFAAPPADNKMEQKPAEKPADNPFG